MARVAYFLHGRGRGHGSRSFPIARHLRAVGHEVTVFAGRDAMDLAGPDDPATAIESVMPGAGALPAAARRYRGDRAALQRLRAQLVVSDGDMPSLLVARREGLPSVAVGHELVFTRCGANAHEPVFERVYQGLNSWHSRWLPDHAIAVHFLPLDSPAADVSVARADLGWIDAARGRATIGDFLVAYFRDGNGRELLAELVARGERVVCFGPFAEPVAGVDHRGFDPSGFREALLGCRGVVGSSGSNLIAEAIALGKPLLACHLAGEAEQALNAQMCQAAGLAVAAEFGGPVDPAATFAERLRRGDFASVDLLGLMRPVSRVMEDTLRALLAG